MANALYYGDNLDVLRESIASESVDLVYLDPPFNSQANYNVLFKGPSGKGGHASVFVDFAGKGTTGIADPARLTVYETVLANER
jgi:hypothetical protein